MLEAEAVVVMLLEVLVLPVDLVEAVQVQPQVTSEQEHRVQII
jgi:hypothetical protein